MLLLIRGDIQPKWQRFTETFQRLSQRLLTSGKSIVFVATPRGSAAERKMETQEKRKRRCKREKVKRWALVRLGELCALEQIISFTTISFICIGFEEYKFFRITYWLSLSIFHIFLYKVNKKRYNNNGYKWEKYSMLSSFYRPTYDIIQYYRLFNSIMIKIFS